MYRRYADRAEFLAVYVRETKPVNGNRTASNDWAGVLVRQPADRQERRAVANQCCTTLGVTMPMVVDEINDRVARAYSGIPDRFYVIDRQGRVAYKSGRGPYGLKSGEMEQALILLLLDEELSGRQAQYEAAGWEAH